MVAARDVRDDFSPVQEQDHKIVLASSQELAEQIYTYVLPMRMKPGDYELSVRLLDRISSTSGARVIRFVAR